MPVQCENMKLLASKSNEKKFFLRSQLYALAYMDATSLPGYYGLNDMSILSGFHRIVIAH